MTDEPQPKLTAEEAFRELFEVQNALRRIDQSTMFYRADVGFEVIDRIEQAKRRLAEYIGMEKLKE